MWLFQNFNAMQLNNHPFFDFEQDKVGQHGDVAFTISSRQRRINFLTDRNNQSGCRKNVSVCQKQFVVLTSVHATNLLQIRPLDDVQLHSCRISFCSTASQCIAFKLQQSHFFVPDGIQFYLSVRYSLMMYSSNVVRHQAVSEQFKSPFLTSFTCFAFCNECAKHTHIRKSASLLVISHHKERQQLIDPLMVN